MPQLQDAGSIIEMTPFKGIDGSTSITGTPEEYCRQLENCDISTYKKLSKRAGYQVHNNTFPVKLSKVFDGINYRPEVTFIREMVPSTVFPFTDAALKLSVDYATCLTTRSLSTSFCIMKTSDATSKNITEETLLGITGVASTYFFFPKAVYTYYKTTTDSDQFIVISAADYVAIKAVGAWAALPATCNLLADAGEAVTDQFLTFSSLRFPRIVESEITVVSNTMPGTVDVSYTGSAITVGDKVYFDTVSSGAGTVSSVNAGTNFIVTGVTDAALVVKNFFSMRYLPVGFISYFNISSSTVIGNSAAVLASQEGMLFTADNSTEIWAYGTGIDAGTINNVDVYRDGDYSNLLAVYGGQLFTEATPQYYTVKIWTMPPLSAAAYTITNPSLYHYHINQAGIGSYFQVNDILTAVATATDGTVTTKTMVVISKGANDIGVTYNYPTLTFTGGETLNYTRTSETIPIDVTGIAGNSVFYKGKAIQIGNSGNNYPWHIVKNYTAGYVTLSAAITFSSSSYIYNGNEWAPVPGKHPHLTPRQQVGNTQRSYSSFFDSSFWLSTEDSGISRYDGSNYYTQTLLRPIIYGVRSVPSSKGTYGIVRVDSNKRLGETQRFKLTYSYTDNLGRTIESCPTDASECIFTPEAASDGTDYSQLIELQVLAPRSLFGYFPGTLYINVYRSRVDIETTTELDYRLEKTVQLFSQQTASVLPSAGKLDDIIYIITLGDNTATSLQQVYSIAFKENIPAPKAKYLIATGNRLVALNSKTLPHISFSPETVFSTVDAKTFVAGLKFHFYMGRYTSEVQEKTFGMQSFPLGFTTFPFGVSNATAAGSTRSSIAAGTGLNIDCYNLNYQLGTVNAAANGFYVSSVGAPLVLTYSDTSNLFTATFLANVNASASTRTVFRCLMTGTLPDIFPINFVEDEMTCAAAVGVTTSIVTANTKWTDPLVSVSSTPTSLKDWNAFAAFQFIWGADASETDSSIQIPQVFVSVVEGKDTVILSSLNTLDVYFTVNKYYVFKGLGTTGSFQEASNTQILNFDRDLVLKCTVAVGVLVDVSDTQANYEYTFKVVKLTKNVTTATIVQEDASFKPVAKATVAFFSGKIDVFKMVQDSATSTSAVICSFGTFNNPATTMTVSQAGSGMGTAINAAGAGQYVNIELNSADKSKISRYYPQFSGGFPAIKGADADTLIVTVPSTFELMSSSAAHTCEAGSYLTWLNMRVSSPSAGVLRVRCPQANVATKLSTYPFCFLLFRGYDWNSVNLNLSGYYLVKQTVTGSGVLDDYVDLYMPYTKSIDYTRFSSIEKSYILSGTYASSVNYLPVPVPYQAGAPEELHDLAAPMFTLNKDLAFLPVNAVSKRFTYAVNYALGDYLYATTEDLSDLNIAVPVNGFTILKPRNTPAEGIRNVTGTLFNATVLEDDYILPVSTTANIWKATGVINSKYDSVNITTNNTTPYYLAEILRPNLINYTDIVATNTPSAFVAQFKRAAQYDLGSTDDSEITGAVVYNNLLLVFKRNSIWKITFGDTIYAITAQRIQATVGAYSNNNIVASDIGVYFVHDSGVYITDGNKVIPVFKLNQYFNERVIKDPATLALGAGYCDTESRNIYLGVDYASDFSTAITASDAQFNYSYNDNVEGWQVNTHIDAVKWARMFGKSYFASTRGAVYRMRVEEALTKFTDGDEAIPFAIQTRFLTTEQGQKFKFYRNAIFQFGTTSNCSYNVYYSRDYKTTLTLLDTIPITEQSLSNGLPVYGSTRYLKGLRDTIGLRMAQISFTLTENSVNTDSPVYFIGVEGFLQNTRLVPQRLTPSSSGQQR